MLTVLWLYKWWTADNFFHSWKRQESFVLFTKKKKKPVAQANGFTDRKTPRHRTNNTQHIYSP